MAVAREERIVLDLQAAYRAIAPAIGATYTVDADAVSVNPDDFTPDLIIGALQYNPAILVLVDNGRQIGHSGGMQQREDVPITVIAAADVEVLDPLAKLRAIQTLHADLELAVTQDITRGGLATDTRIDDKQHDAPTGSPRILAIQTLLVRVHRTYGDPNS